MGATGLSFLQCCTPSRSVVATFYCKPSAGQKQKQKIYDYSKGEGDNLDRETRVRVRPSVAMGVLCRSGVRYARARQQQHSWNAESIERGAAIASRSQ